MTFCLIFRLGSPSYWRGLGPPGDADPEMMLQHLDYKIPNDPSRSSVQVKTPLLDLYSYGQVEVEIIGIVGILPPSGLSEQLPVHHRSSSSNRNRTASRMRRSDRSTPWMTMASLPSLCLAPRPAPDPGAPNSTRTGSSWRTSSPTSQPRPPLQPPLPPRPPLSSRTWTFLWTLMTTTFPR